MNQKLRRCKVCGAEIAKTARLCPHCGAKNKKPIYMRAWFILLLIILTLFVIRSFNVARNEREHEKAGYGVFQLEDGTTATAKDINALYDESAVSAKNTYIGQTVTVTMEVTNISNWAIEDAVSLVRFSYSDYMLNNDDYIALSNLREGDIIQVTGVINTIGGGNWYIELNKITSLNVIKQE